MRDVDVCDFIKAVFKFDWADIHPKTADGAPDYKLSAPDMKDLLETSKETTTYDPLAKLTNALLVQLYGTEDVEAEARCKAIIR